METFDRARMAVRRLSPRRRATGRVERAAAAAPGLPFSLEIIPSAVHGVLDYVLGAGTIAAPLVFGFAHIAPARLVMQVQGGGALAYSLLTDYEWGVRRILPFRTHLLLDLLGGAFLMASPWLLGFPRWGRIHLALGLFELAVTLMSRRQVGGR